MMELPRCQYRGPQSGDQFSCAAAEGALVNVRDCLTCPIPEAISHKDACLYMVPLRHEGVGRFACRWFFSSANEPAPENWRDLCFCPYWFPRPLQEDMIPELEMVRARYLRVLRGEEPRMLPRLPSGRSPNADKNTRGLRDWLHRLLDAVRSV